MSFKFHSSVLRRRRSRLECQAVVTRRASIEASVLMGGGSGEGLRLRFAGRGVESSKAAFDSLVVTDRLSLTSWGVGSVAGLAHYPIHLGLDKKLEEVRVEQV